MTYCIIVKREIEEDCVLHHDFETPPTRDEVLAVVMDADLNYNDDYGRIEYYPV